MATKKISLNELRSLVKQIIKEAGNIGGFPDLSPSRMSDSEVRDAMQADKKRRIKMKNLENQILGLYRKYSIEVNNFYLGSLPEENKKLMRKMEDIFEEYISTE